jgi:methionyl-tRNA synthetase
MSMQNQIICPNCGAENERYGKCEYCGSVIENIDDVTEKYISHGKQKVTIDERVLIQKYDKFEDKTETIFRCTCTR